MAVEEELHERWRDLTSWVNDDVRVKWWRRIVDDYSEPHRKYHTLTHLHQMFQHYDQHKDALTDRYALAYAIFFHDIVYDVKASDNEMKSADVFRKFCHETTLDSEHYITDLIAATASHCTDAHLHADAPFGADDVHYFLDVDMAVLGADQQDYEQYSAQIRQEYAHLDDRTYARERNKVLRLFLQIPNIFATKTFRESYEERARANILRETEQLQKLES